MSKAARTLGVARSHPPQFETATPGRFRRWEMQGMVAETATSLQCKVTNPHESQGNHAKTKSRGEGSKTRVQKSPELLALVDHFAASTRSACTAFTSLSIEGCSMVPLSFIRNWPAASITATLVSPAVRPNIPSIASA